MPGEGQEFASMFVKIGADVSDLKIGVSQIKEAFGSMAEFAGIALGGIGLLELGKQSLDAASQAQQAAIGFGQALGAIKVNYDDVASSSQNFFEKLQETTGFQKDEVESATTRLIQITQNYAESIKLTSVAADLARARHMDLQSASQLVGRVYEGNTTILRRYGIELQKGTSATQALDELQRRFAGSASIYMETYAGQLDKLKNKWHEVSEKLGTELMPLSLKFIDIISKLVDWVGNIISIWDKMSNSAKGLTVSIGAAIIGGMALYKSFMLIEGALEVMIPLFEGTIAPILTWVAAIIGAGSAIVWFTENWNKLEALFDEVIYSIESSFAEWSVDILRIAEKAFSWIPGMYGKIDSIKSAFINTMNEIDAKSAASAQIANQGWISYGDMFDQAKTKIMSGMNGIGNEFQVVHQNFAKQANQAAISGTQSYDSFFSTIMSMAQTFSTTFATNFSQSFQLFEKGTIDITKAFEKAVDQMVQKIIESGLLNLIGLIFGAPAGGFGVLGNIFGTGTGFGGNIPATADGGIVTGPQVRLVGEAGPEAIIPLDQIGSVMNKASGNSTTVQHTHIHLDSLVNTMTPSDLQKSILLIGNGLRKQGMI